MRRRRASVQAAYVRVEAIRDGVVRLAGGRACAVLEVPGVSFGWRGEEEQETIVASFAAFLNALPCPVQLLVQVQPVDLEPQQAMLERRAAALPPELAALARDQARFLAGLGRKRRLFERRAYLVVASAVAATRSRWPWSWPSPFTACSAGAGADEQLAAHCAEILRQLGRCGLAARRLGDLELAQLYQRCWQPERSRVQRLRRSLAEYEALVIGGQSQGRRACKG